MTDYWGKKKINYESHNIKESFHFSIFLKCPVPLSSSVTIAIQYLTSTAKLIVVRILQRVFDSSFSHYFVKKRHIQILVQGTSGSSLPQTDGMGHDATR